jgi:hypothetical protein
MARINSQEPNDIEEIGERRGIGEADTESSLISFRDRAGIFQIDNSCVNPRCVFNLPIRNFGFLIQVSRILENAVTHSRECCPNILQQCS